MKVFHALSLSLLALGIAGTVGRADVVTDWNTVALKAIRADRTAPPVASRALAIMHAAIYDAVNGVRRTHQPYLTAGMVPASASVDAAAAAAAHKVLVNIYPQMRTNFDAALVVSLAAVRNGPQKNAGRVWGEYVADRILAARAHDGSTNVVAPPGGSGPGVWVPTPPAYAPYLLPQWGFLKPFCMSTQTEFRPAGPPALDSAKWAADYSQIKALGAATNSTRTPDQSEIALFWADGSGTETPPGHWNSVAQTVAAAQGNTVEQNARLFALLNLALADAAVCAWDAKYYFHFWRAVTAIRNGDTDGNPDTEPDPNWSSFIVTPPFPDYVSGHATFSGAAATVLALFYGTDHIAFTCSSDFMPGVHRSFSSFSAAAQEAADSRLYGGIHYRTANEDGLRAGADLGQMVVETFLLPKNNRSRIR